MKCPNCGGPASQPIMEIYCKNDCSKGYSNNKVFSHMAIVTLGDGSTCWLMRKFTPEFKFSKYRFVPMYADFDGYDASSLNEYRNFSYRIGEGDFIGCWMLCKE